MIRFAILLLLITLWAPSAWAAIHSCRMPDGTIHLTDDPERFPPDCEPVGVLELPAPPAPDPTALPPHIPPDEPPPDAPPAVQPWPMPEEPMEEETSPMPEEPVEEEPTEPVPPGSAGFPPGLQPQQQAVEETEEFPLEAPPDPGAPRLDPWMEEAQALSREFSEARQAPEGQPDEDPLTLERLQQIEARINTFIEQLGRSGLSPGEQDAVMRELPPQE